MDTNKHNKNYEIDIVTALELSEQTFRCSYHTFMTEIKTTPDFPTPIGNPNRKGKLHWLRDEVIAWRNKNYRRLS